MGEEATGIMLLLLIVGQHEVSEGVISSAKKFMSSSTGKSRIWEVSGSEMPSCLKCKKRDNIEGGRTYPCNKSQKCEDSMYKTVLGFDQSRQLIGLFLLMLNYFG
ncbi:uncharacterized protein A4U43_C04F1820 [Asparagus officinalis]|uniref:Uncharacterized protein n=1 Tax=Asparagus officinalis TaxID=4686 RepID=A0A5P1EXI9_ASPOF|nr:uncharacterized protein A4U43_C04F1820 [Asparagus officinalis]